MSICFGSDSGRRLTLYCLVELGDLFTFGALLLTLLTYIKLDQKK